MQPIVSCTAPGRHWQVPSMQFAISENLESGMHSSIPVQVPPIPAVLAHLVPYPWWFSSQVQLPPLQMLPCKNSEHCAFSSHGSKNLVAAKIDRFILEYDFDKSIISKIEKEVSFSFFPHYDELSKSKRQFRSSWINWALI